MSTNHNSIYKLHHLIDKETTKTIYVFYGNNLDVPNPEELFKKDPRNVAFVDQSTGKPLFNDLELEKIQDVARPIDVKFLKQQIHFDDSIGAIKLKIIEAFTNAISLEQIYLFCMREEIINATNIYQILTQKGRLELTKIRIDQYLLNVRDESGASFASKLPVKESYDYDDIFNLDLKNKKCIVSTVLGQKFFIVENEYPFVCNPFDVVEYDTFIERAARKSLTTLNSHLLLSSGEISDNNIYLCLAEDVLIRAKNNNISENATISIYYPFLQRREINSYDELQDKKFSLIEENKSLLSKNTLDTFESINMFYDVYKYKKETNKYKYKNSGVKSLKLTIHPEFSIKIPLDVIFKIIHATEANPFIKYNPSSKLENIYRLYTDNLSTDGRKIPFLTKTVIFKLMRDIGKSKSVAVYINSADDSSLLICEFEENGNIVISCEFDKIINVEAIETIIKKQINPIIQEVKDYLEQNGYTISLYESMYSNNVDVKQINYQSSIEITKPIKINDFIGCITSAFIIETKDLKSKNGINMRFKRVANFNKVTSQEAFVIEQSNKKDGLKGNEIILALVENYRMEESEARALLAKLASEVQVERGVKRRDVEIKSNPGFKTNITLNSITGVITINVENINDIYYLQTIPIYLDSFIRLTQDKTSTLVPTKRINALCSTDEKFETVVEDIVAPSELAFPEQEIPIIDEDDMGFEDFSEYVKGVEELKEPKFKSALDLIYGDDEYDDYEEEPEGGMAHGTGNYGPGKDKNRIAGGNSSDEMVPVKVTKKVVAKTAPKKLIIQEDNADENADEDADEKVRNVVGMRLKNPTPFAAKMHELEPTIFLKEDRGKFGRYSRICSSSAKKQPVMITEEEMQEMNNEERDKIIKKYGKDKFDAFPKAKQDEIIKAESFLRPEDVIKYGSKPDNKYYYVCPRYWCLKTNRPIDPKEMVEVVDPKTGNKVKRHPTCGGIIPDGQDEIKNDGNYVYEFFDKQEHRSRDDKDYKKHYPGFMTANKHPDGLCVPCCFAKWNTPKQINRRKECAQNDEEEEKDEKEQDENEKDENEKDEKEQVPDKKTKQPVRDQLVVERDNYVKGPEKFPLDSGRWGYLQVAIQNFLQEASLTCQISKTNANIKLNHACLLRHGVEFTEKQSFIACIADAKYYAETANVPTVSEMKKIIKSALNIDAYITYQNGNNVTNFMVDDANIIDAIDIKKYESSRLYKKIYNSQKKTNPVEDKYFKKVVASFENFIAYLSDENESIDYTYLWDIICVPNPALFVKGLNLIIMEIVNNDITNNIELICPTNHYSNEIYNPSKQSLFLIKNGNLFEPIYLYENKGTSVKVTKFFSENNQALSPNMRDIFKKIIKPLFSTACSPMPSMPNVYKFKQPVLLSNLITSLIGENYKIEKQILNYQSKVIGVYARKDKLSGYVPCYPSAMDSNYSEFVFMDDTSLYNNYEKTVRFLQIVYKDTKGVSLTNPEFKIVEDEHVVGLLTETNQFIQLSEPHPVSSTSDSIPVINDNNYILNKNIKPMESGDFYISTTGEIDTERSDYIKKIKLETNFYNSFRNTVRILLNDYENIKKRRVIEDEITKPYILYLTKLRKIISLLKELVNDTNSIAFADSYDYKTINAISTCITLPKDKCASKLPVCSIVKGDKCQLIIPKKNILNPTNDNETVYFGKMADELIRYSRIKSFIFQPQTYLSFGTLGYNLRENEIIVIHSLLTKDYFDGLTPANINKYVKYNTYDTTEPKISQIYDNSLDINKTMNVVEKKENEYNCNPIKTNISSKIWKDSFPIGCNELYYDKENCGFSVISDIIKKFNGTALTVEDIKQNLIEEYGKYFVNYGAQILDILILEGKNAQGKKVKQKVLSLQDFIYSDNYFITNLDIWVIMNKYKIPSIIVSSKSIILANRTKNNLVLYDDSSNKFIFIVSPSLRADNVPKYSIIISADDSMEISLNVLRDEEAKRSISESISSQITLEKMFQTFTKKLTGVKKKPPLSRNIIIQDDTP
jgi:hypothetical protein